MKDALKHLSQQCRQRNYYCYQGIRTVLLLLSTECAVWNHYTGTTVAHNNHTACVLYSTAPVNVEPQDIYISIECYSTNVLYWNTGVFGWNWSVSNKGAQVCHRPLTIDVRTSHLHEAWTQHCRSTLSYILTSKRVLVNQEFCSLNISRGIDTRTNS